MKKYRDEDILKAKELREKEHYSFIQLQQITGIPAPTIRNWCKDIRLGSKWDILLVTNERKRLELKKSELSLFDELEILSPAILKIVLSLIYWCEGSKYPSTNIVAFTNSDPGLVKLFVNLFRKAFFINESKFRIHVQIHSTHNVDEIKTYWSNLLEIPTSQFIKPTITQKKNGKHRSEYLGTCSVRYLDFRILLKLIGIYEEFIKREIV